MSPRAALLGGAAVAAATLGAWAATGAAAPASSAGKCPIAITAAVRWALSANANGYTHGRGTFLGSRATGTICEQKFSGSQPRADLVLAVGGRGAALSRGITVDGVLGAQLVLPVSVAATDRPRCRVGAHGRVTLFSSYNGARKDSVKLAFGAGCSVHNSSARGAGVHARCRSERAESRTEVSALDGRRGGTDVVGGGLLMCGDSRRLAIHTPAHPGGTRTT